MWRICRNSPFRVSAAPGRSLTASSTPSPPGAALRKLVGNHDLALLGEEERPYPLYTVSGWSALAGPYLLPRPPSLGHLVKYAYLETSSSASWPSP
jgi:hypothetical protein